MMKIKNIFGAIGAVFFVLYAGSASAWIEVGGEPVTITPPPVVDSIIVKFAEIEGQKRGEVDITAMKQQIFDMSDVNFEHKDSSLSETFGMFVFQITEEDGARLQKQGSEHIESMLDALVSKLNQDPAIEVEKNTIFSVQLHSPGELGSREPDDVLYKSEQWHYQGETIGDDIIRSRGVNLPLAWGHHTIGSEDSVIAVVDTGIVKSYYGEDHENLEGKILDGYNFVEGELGQPPVDNGSLHGTHVAGTIAAKTNHNLRVAGLGDRHKEDTYLYKTAC
ncbi:MAG: S8 family serine peptidase [Gammaproteobacteria bacterium]